MYRSTKEYEDAPEVEQIAEQVIQDKGMDLHMCDVKYLKVYPHISKTTAGKCKALNRREHHLSGGYDYAIEMSGELWDSLGPDRRYILTWHELMHIYPVYNDNKGEWNYKVRKHDVEDFEDIIEQHGADWFSEIKDINSSLYDLDPEKARKLNA
jgi:predicted metallopeptidase